MRLLPAFLIASIGFATSVASQSADTVYTNGNIYTVDAAAPFAEAVAIKDGKFIAVGAASDIAKHAGSETVTIDLGGSFVMPGMVDTHTHPFISEIVGLNQLRMGDVSSLEEIQAAVAEYAAANPDIEWLEGQAWPKGIFPKEIGKREWLDEVVPDRPICLMDQGGHAYWCNTLALEKAGIMSPDFEEPAFSIIERGEDGVPLGVQCEKPPLVSSKRLFLRPATNCGCSRARTSKMLWPKMA